MGLLGWSREELEKKAEENKDLLSGIKEVLGDKVKDVKISSRLVDDPVCLSLSLQALGRPFQL